MYTLINATHRTRETFATADDISDGYHTFSELYKYRRDLFKVIVNLNSGKSWKSKLHDDGSMYDDMFIVGISTPEGQFSIHVDIEFFEEFKCEEIEYAPEWDGHTMNDIDRLLSLGGSNDE